MGAGLAIYGLRVAWRLLLYATAFRMGVGLRVRLYQRLERLQQRKTLLKPILQALDRGKPVEVLNACIALCKQDPRYAPLCLRYRADALRDMNQNEALERLYDGIIADRPLPWAFAGLGKLLFKRGQVGEAKAVYEKALKVFPMMPGLYDGLADVLVADRAEA